MSTKCLAWAVEQTTGSATNKLILMLLADLADEQFTCFPGRKRLARDSELSERTVSTAVTALVEAGFVRVLRRARKRGGRTSNRYLIMMYGTDTPLPDIDDWVSEFVTDVEAHHVRDAAGDGNGENASPMLDGDRETAGQSNGEAGAPLPAGGKGDLPSRSTGNELPFSRAEDFDPPGFTEDQSPPPTVTHATGDAGAAAARAVLRQVTADVPVDRLPTETERDRLVDLVAGRLAAGWDAERLAARLRGMGRLSTVASVYAVLVSRLRQVGDPPPSPVVAAARRVLPWCGAPTCDRTTRRVVDTDDRPVFELVDGELRPAWCPICAGH